MQDPEWELRKIYANIFGRSYMKFLLGSTPSPIQKTLQLCRQVMKLRIMNVDMKTKVLIKFGASTMMCVDLRPK